MDKEYIHWFFPKSRPRPRFDLVHKGDSFLLEGSGIRELRHEVGRILEPFGFEPGSRPLWKDGCVVPLLHADLISGRFAPAAGKIMLAGDAAGLIFPVTFEGIGAALESGLAAADSISQAEMNGSDPAGIYLRALTPLLGVLRRLHSLQEHLYHEAGRGARILSKALAAAYRATLHVDL